MLIDCCTLIEIILYVQIKTIPTNIEIGEIPIAKINILNLHNIQKVCLELLLSFIYSCFIYILKKTCCHSIEDMPTILTLHYYGQNNNIVSMCKQKLT